MRTSLKLTFGSFTIQPKEVSWGGKYAPSGLGLGGGWVESNEKVGIVRRDGWVGGRDEGA